MKISLSSKKEPEIELLALDIEKKKVDFKWLDGRYAGVCSAEVSIDLSDSQLNEIAKQLALSIDSQKDDSLLV